ncbi:hypothetical protein BDQ12DRAFT_53404 [Crucibulum laeve]|uniref:Secreted protein n=1 Tax=Crucibulum laeve TaxID=68775 RepID=A0A5C3M2A2_9AGAR|nr:hypothetical protein BDQ12DRAFT_53404 [Crucibulum laeve]
MPVTNRSPQLFLHCAALSLTVLIHPESHCSTQNLSIQCPIISSVFRNAYARIEWLDRTYVHRMIICSSGSSRQKKCIHAQQEK